MHRFHLAVHLLVALDNSKVLKTFTSYSYVMLLPGL